MAPLVMALGALAALGVGYKVLSPKPRFTGDLAKAGPLGIGPSSGDQVEVLVPDLLRANSSLSVGTAGPAAGQIPPGATSVIVHVLGASKDVLQGPITTIGQIPLPTPIGSVMVPRQDVKAVFRNGKTARSTAGNFAGDRSSRYMG